MEPRSNLKVFFIKLLSITVAIIVIINVFYNIFLADKMDVINKISKMDKESAEVIKNKIRLEIKSGLEKDKLFLTLNNLRSSNNTVKFYIEQNKKDNSFFDKKNNKLFLNEIFFKQPHEVVLRSFSDFLRIIGGNYFSARGKKIEYVLEKIDKDTLKKETLAGCIIKKINQTVIISKEC